MALADGLAAFSSGAATSLGVLVLSMGLWQRRRLLVVPGAALLACALTIWLSRASLWTLPAAVIVLVAGSALTLWLVHRAFHALQASRRQHVQLEQRVTRRDGELEQARQQLRQAQAGAELADQAKARFLAAASHDLRQPAHALGLYTAALRAGPLEPGQAEIAERMQGTLAALEDLFTALLDLSRVDAGAVVPQWHTLALAPLLQRLAEEWAPQAEARGLRLALHIGDPAAMSVTDPLLLGRVLRNLLANAVRYTSQGGVLLACRLRHGAEGLRHYRIEVWDSGPGIVAAAQERVFEEFYQVGPPGRDRQRGLGLGLAIVQRLARLLQLRVTLHSRPGHGSVFFVEGLAPAGPAPLMAAAARRQMRRLAGLRVVVLEDDVEVRDAMRRLLLLWECHVVDGANAAALRQRLGTVPDAVVADLRLADGRTGPAELRALQAAWGRPVPVLWISGETDTEALNAVLPPGAAVLTKPVSPDRLRAWLEQRLPEAVGTDSS